MSRYTLTIKKRTENPKEFDYDFENASRIDYAIKRAVELVEKDIENEDRIFNVRIRDDKTREYTNVCYNPFEGHVQVISE